MREREKAGTPASVERRAVTRLLAGSLFLALVIAGFFSTDAGAQQQRSIEAVILRPAPNPTFDEIFDAIVVGVRPREPALSITERRINAFASSQAMRNAISSDAPEIVVTLGRQADEFYRSSGLEIRQVVGGLDVEPGLGRRNGVSLTADPVFILSRLKTLMPEKRRVIVVYDPSKDSWLIERAKAVSASIGVTIVAHEASTLSEASSHYWNILKYGNPETDVLWLLSNPSFVSNNNLPRLVEESWRRNFTIISNNIDHARRGALIAIYPDLEAMGAQLADLAIATSENPNKRPEIEPLGAVKFAVNKRVANHLGVSISAQDERSFDLILGSDETMLNRFRQMRISRQLSVTAGASIILFTITLTAITSTLISRQLRDSAVTDARLQTEQFAERSIFAFLVDDLTVAEEAIGSITAFPNIDDARLIRADGETLARYNIGNAIDDADNPIRHLTDIRESSDYWIVAAPVLSSSEPSDLDGEPANAEYLGSVVLAFSKSPVRETIRTIWIINGLAGLAAAGIFLALLSFQMRVLTDPLRSLSSTMSNGGRDAPRKRARVFGSKEIQEIAAIYNQLMDEIEKSQAALESEVTIRTQELKTARDAAFAANRQKSEIMAAVTHEMKTPLQAIIGYAQLTLEELEFAVEDDAAHRSREQLSNILGRAHELLNRITQMLDLARAEAGKFDLNLVETDISALIHDAQKSILPLAAERNNKFTAEIDCPATVLIDRDKFQQIALNLMTNACKFTHKGEIHLKCEGRPDQLILEVEDTGVGIAEKDLDSVFEPFRQVDMSASRAFGGTGLGLAVSREFAKLMGGKIIVRSELGAGSVFTTTIPLPIKLGAYDAK